MERRTHTGSRHVDDVPDGKWLRYGGDRGGSPWGYRGVEVRTAASGVSIDIVSPLSGLATTGIRGDLIYANGRSVWNSSSRITICEGGSLMTVHAKLYLIKLHSCP